MRGDMVAAVTRDALVIGTIDGDAVVAGGSLVVEGTVGGSVRVLSGSVEVRGTVGGDVLAGSGRVIVADGGSVDGDIITAAFSLDVAGHVGRSVLGRVWRARISGDVDDNIEIDARQTRVGRRRPGGWRRPLPVPFGSGRRGRRRGGGDGWAEEQRPCGACPIGRRGHLGVGSPRLSGRRAAHPPGGPGVERPCRPTRCAIGRSGRSCSG